MTVHQILEPNIVPELVIRHGGFAIPVCKQSCDQVLDMLNGSQLSLRKVEASVDISAADI